jgi:N-acyl-D-aspartate/D-glutamate deacylase
VESWGYGGGGKPAYRADVAVSSDAIATIAPRIESGATRVIDVGGQVLAPGFIDVHTHVLILRLIDVERYRIW